MGLFSPNTGGENALGILGGLGEGFLKGRQTAYNQQQDALNRQIQQQQLQQQKDMQDWQMKYGNAQIDQMKNEAMEQRRNDLNTLFHSYQDKIANGDATIKDFLHEAQGLGYGDADVAGYAAMYPDLPQTPSTPPASAAVPPGTGAATQPAGPAPQAAPPITNGHYVGRNLYHAPDYDGTGQSGAPTSPVSPSTAPAGDLTAVSPYGPVTGPDAIFYGNKSPIGIIRSNEQDIWNQLQSLKPYAYKKRAMLEQQLKQGNLDEANELAGLRDHRDTGMTNGAATEKSDQATYDTYNTSKLLPEQDPRVFDKYGGIDPSMWAQIHGGHLTYDQVVALRRQLAQNVGHRTVVDQANPNGSHLAWERGIDTMAGKRLDRSLNDLQYQLGQRQKKNKPPRRIGDFDTYNA